MPFTLNQLLGTLTTVWVVPLSEPRLTPGPLSPRVYGAEAFGVGHEVDRSRGLNHVSVSLPLQRPRLRLDCGQLRQEPAITGLDWLFTPTLESEERLHAEPLQASTPFYGGFTLPKSRSSGFGSYPRDSRRFHTASLVNCGVVLSLRVPATVPSPRRYTPWHVIQNGRYTSEDAYPTITARFQGLCTPRQGFFSAFPHGTLRYRTQHVFRVGSTCLPASRLISKRRYSRNCLLPGELLARGYHPVSRPVPGNLRSPAGQRTAALQHHIPSFLAEGEFSLPYTAFSRPY